MKMKRKTLDFGIGWEKDWNMECRFWSLLKIRTKSIDIDTRLGKIWILRWVGMEISITIIHFEAEI
jgi:hypothetical protein